MTISTGQLRRIMPRYNIGMVASDFVPFVPRSKGWRFIDKTGQRFGRLTAIRPMRKHGHTTAHWECVCDCGDLVTVSSLSLVTGHTKSCGCLQRDRVSEVSATHGMSRTPTYNCWCTLRQRCLDPNVPCYPRYGGRGITVCERWNIFENFLADMGEKPRGMSIERIDNNGNYEPDNCRWATATEQANNRRSTMYVDYQGELLSLAALARQIGVKYHALYFQVVTRANSVADAVAYLKK